MEGDCQETAVGLEYPQVLKEGQKERDRPAGRFFYGWRIVGASFLICAVAYGTQYSFGVFFKPIQQEFGWSRALVSGAVSVYWIGHGAFSILMGWGADKYGPRKVMALAGFIAGLALLLVSRIQASWQLYLFYGILFSLGISAVWTVLTTTVSRWFVQRRGMALGLIAAGTGTGTVVLPPLSRYLISGYGWRTTYAILGLAFWLFVILVISGIYLMFYYVPSVERAFDTIRSSSGVTVLLKRTMGNGSSFRIE